MKNYKMKDRKKACLLGAIGAVLISGCGGGNRSVTPGDDGRIVYMSGLSGNQDIYAMKPDGTNKIRLTTDPQIDDQPQWSPDRSKIAFLSGRFRASAHFPELCVMNADGSNQRRLTSLQGSVGKFSWSWDSRYITFPGANTQGADAGIYVVDTDSGTLQRVLPQTQAGQGGNPIFRPRSFQIAFVTNLNGTGMYLMNRDGSAITKLADQVSPLAWSPQGDRLLVDSVQGLKVVNATTREVRLLTPSRAVKGAAVWHPSGERIFVAQDINIWSYKPDGTEQQRIYQGRVGSSLSISPDGRHLAFECYGVDASGRSRRDICRMDVDGTNRIQLTDESNINIQPDWR